MSTAQLRNAFLAFRAQCIWLQVCYDTYRNLYESDEDTEDLLERTAPQFFHDLNEVLVEYCLLQVSKLTDPPCSSGRDNLTVKNLNNLLAKVNLLTPEMSSASDGLQHYRSLIKDTRNRIISHADRGTLLAGQPIGAHLAADVSSFFENLYRYVDAVGEAVGVGPLDFRSTSGPGDVLDLLRFLRAGLTRPSG